MDNTTFHSTFDKLIGQLSREISIITPGSDNGLLPLRELFSNLTQKSSGDPLLSTFHLNASQGLQKMDAVMDSLQPFSEEDIAFFKNILAKLQSEGSEDAISIPAPPEGFSSPTPSPSATEAATEPETLSSILSTLLDQLAMELVLSEPGSDKSAQMIAEISGKLSDKSANETNLEQLNEYAHRTQSYIQSIIDQTRKYTEEDLGFLNNCLNQMKSSYKGSSTFVPHSDVTSIAELEGKSEASTNAPTPFDDLSSLSFEKSAQATQPTPAPVAAPAPAPVPVVPAAETAKPEPHILVSEIPDVDLLGDFFNEAVEHLENIEQGVLKLEENPEDNDTLNSVFRAFHTLKGGSGFLNLTAIQSLAHELESLLDLARQGKLRVTSGVINLILEGGDTIKKFVAEIRLQTSGQKPVSPVAIPTLNLIARVKDVVSGKVTPDAIAAAPKVESASAVSTPAASASAPTSAATAPVEDHSPLAEAAHHPEASAGKPVAQATTHAPTVQSNVVKVDTNKLDALFDMVGEMVIAQSLISQDPELINIKSQKLVRNLAQLSRITNELQKTAMSMRMVPIRATFQKMNRVVRDIAAKTGKQIELKLSGEDTELDRTIVEEISDPLVHMVRNSVDHGIEPAAVRMQNGKSTTGVVTLNAFHQGGNIIIQIKDDGGGLNRDRIFKKGIEKGLIHESDPLSDKEIYNLIFAPGFSTAEKITDISGRGVGMDVVRKNIEKLRGKVEIESIPGQGTTFSIYLPLTLAIIEGLIIRVAKERYIVPTLAVRESFRPTKEMISTVQQRGEMVNVRGRLLPILRLHKYFSIDGAVTNATDAIVLVLESGHDQRCLMVDELVGKQEVVIKSLADQFKSNKYLAGAAIMGDGQVGLILDTSSIVHTRD